MPDSPSTLKAASSYMAASDAVYQVLRTNQGQVASTLAAGTYLSGASLLATAAAAGQQAFYLDPADFAVTGLTHAYQMRAALFTNATSLGTQTITIGLAPVSATAGGNDINTITVSAQTSGSTCAFVNPGTSTRFQIASGDFTPPTAGYFTVSAITTATIATNARISFTWFLLSRNT